MSSRNKLSRRSKGFTLLEVLVAMSIMAVIATMSWQGVDAIVRARESTDGHLNRLLRLNTVMAQFKQDLQMVYETPPRGIPSSFRYDGSRMTIIRKTDQGVQVVVWSFRQGTWFRWPGPSHTTVSGLVDSWRSSQNLMGNEKGQLKALEGLDQIQVFCGRDRAIVNCQSSADQANNGGGQTQDQNKEQGQEMAEAPPEFVQIVLAFGAGSGLSGQMTRSFLVRPL